MNRIVTIFVLLLLLIFLTSCDSNIKDEEVNTELLYKVAQSLMLESGEKTGFVQVSFSNKVLTREVINTYLTREGLYIKIGNRMASEIGIFVPRSSYVVYEDPGADPSFEHIGNSVYRYIVKG